MNIIVVAQLPTGVLDLKANVPKQIHNPIGPGCRECIEIAFNGAPAANLTIPQAVELARLLDTALRALGRS